MKLQRLVHQLVSFGLAAVFTFGILGSIDLLATYPAEPALMAADHNASAPRS